MTGRQPHSQVGYLIYTQCQCLPDPVPWGAEISGPLLGDSSGVLKTLQQPKN